MLLYKVWLWWAWLTLGAAGLQTLHTKLPYITPSMTISSNKE